MKNLSCATIQDLLPLYIDKLTSPETDALIQEHLQHCPGCQKEYEVYTTSLDIPKAALPKGDVRIIWKMRFNYLWYFLWPMLYALSLYWKKSSLVIDLMWLVLTCIAAPTLYSCLDLSVDPEKKTEYYHQENKKINSGKLSTIGQAVFFALPLAVPILFDLFMPILQTASV